MSGPGAGGASSGGAARERYEASVRADGGDRGDRGDAVVPARAGMERDSVEEAAQAAAELEADIARVVTERDEMRELAQRLQADFDNYRKRMLREQSALVERATERLLEELLPVLDNFDSAREHLPAEVDESVRKGVELLFTELLAVLGQAGLERIDVVGTEFDPNVHEAVLREGSDGGAGEGGPVVTEVMRPGYRLRGRTLRPAMVKVAG